MKWKIELDEEMKLPLTEDIREHLEAVQKEGQKILRFKRDLKWSVTNIHSKPFVVWSAFHPWLCDGYGINVLGGEMVIAPGESFEIIVHQNHTLSSVAVACTEYETLEEAQFAHDHYCRTNENYRKYEDTWDDELGWVSEPLFPFQHCELNPSDIVAQIVWHYAELLGLRKPSSSPAKNSSPSE